MTTQKSVNGLYGLPLALVTSGLSSRPHTSSLCYVNTHYIAHYTSGYALHRALLSWQSSMQTFTPCTSHTTYWIIILLFLFLLLLTITITSPSVPPQLLNISHLTLPLPPSSFPSPPSPHLLPSPPSLCPSSLPLLPSFPPCFMSFFSSPFLFSFFFKKGSFKLLFF